MAICRGKLMHDSIGHNHSDSEEKYWRVSEASRYLDVRPCTIYALAKDKKIPCYRIGRLLRFKKADLDGWMAEQIEGHRGTGRRDQRGCPDESFSYPARRPKAKRRAADVESLVKRAIAVVKREGYTNE